MTKKCLCQTPNPPRIPLFYTLTKIHKPTPVGRPIISGCDGPTEKLSAFIDKLLQPITQKQQSHLKDTTDFINVSEKIKVPNRQYLFQWMLPYLVPRSHSVTGNVRSGKVRFRACSVPARPEIQAFLSLGMFVLSVVILGDFAE